MSRAPRIIFEGAVYHVYQRGNNKSYIFDDPNHKAFLLKQLREYQRKFDYQVLAYVIMNNHFHLLIRTNKNSIDEIMFNINNVMAKYLNKQLGRTGHIFENRYNCLVVENEAYLLWLLRYIHRNPIRAEICEDLKDYRWCSHTFYINNLSLFVDTNFILNLLSSNRRQAICRYIDLINTPGSNDNKDKDYELIRNVCSFDEVSLNNNDSNQPLKPKILKLEDILNSINISQEIKAELIKGGRSLSLTPHKVNFLKVALYNKYSLSEIAKFLNTSADALRKLKAYYKITT